MKTTDTLIIAGSIIVAGCIIALSMHRTGEVVSVVVPTASPSAPAAATPAAPAPPAAAATLAVTPAAPVKDESKLAGEWQETGSWGGLMATLQLSPDGTGKFTSPPYSIRCKWSLPEPGQIRTETKRPQEGAPGIFGDTNTTRVWKYAFVDKDKLELTLEGGDEKLSYRRAPAQK